MKSSCPNNLKLLSRFHDRTLPEPFRTGSCVIPDRFLIPPHVTRGMSVGLFGGSFNPPHGGHVLVALLALERLNLDQLWWIVTPGNPLKDKKNLAPLAQRLYLPAAIRNHSRVRLTAFEQGQGLTYTVDTLMFVQKRNPDVNFVWIMGADNIHSFHLWKDWKAICSNFPIAIIDRPGIKESFFSSVMAETFDFCYVRPSEASQLARTNPPACTFIRGPTSTLSSTLIRSHICSSVFSLYRKGK